MSIRVFISHSSQDEDLASAFCELLHQVMPIVDREIRCTSVPGYKLKSGVQTSTTLRRELQSAAVVIGLLTPRSAASGWVLFELGAAWGMELKVIPLVFRLSVDDLPGPLREVHVLEGDDRDDLLQLVDEVAEALAVPKQSSPTINRAIDGFSTMAESWDDAFDEEHDDDLDDEYSDWDEEEDEDDGDEDEDDGDYDG